MKPINKAIGLMLIAIVFGVLIGSSVSAFEFDNIKSYDEETKTLTFKNSIYPFGIPTTTIATATLISNDCEGAQSCSSIINLDLREDYENPIRDIKIMLWVDDQWREMGLRQFDLYEQTGTNNIIKPTYELICSKTETDRWGNDKCEWIQNGTETIQEPIWEQITESTLRQSNYTLKLTIQKEIFNTIDWYGVLFGIESREWAVFDNAIAGYWTFDSNIPSSTTLNQDNTTINNFTDYTGSPVRVTGKVGPFQMDFTKADSDSLGNTTFDFSGITEFSYSFWINVTGNTTEQGIIGANWSTGGGQFRAFETVLLGSGSLSFVVADGSANIVTSAPGINANQSHFVVVTAAEGDQLELYIDNDNVDNTTFAGTFGLKGNASLSVAYRNTLSDIFFDGTLDEVGFFATKLNVSDVNELWNNGNGLPFTIAGVPGIDITLNIPPNNSRSSTINITFNASATPTQLNLTNATLLLYNASTGDLLQSPEIIVTGNETNESIFNIADLSIEQFNWSVLFCGLNNTGSGGTFCTTTTENFTFTIGVQEIASFFVNETVEGTVNPFQINISVPDGRQISTNNLHYNNTVNPGTRTLIEGNNFSIITTQVAPLVPGQTNVSFFWNITLDDGTEFNNPLSNQSVVPLSADDCTVNGVLILNYTLKDEDTQVTTVPDGNLTNSTMQIDLDIFTLGTTNSVINFSQNYTNINPAQVCINQINNSIYSMNAQIRYEFTDHVVEFNNLQNFTLQNSTIPQNINLLDLATANSQEFLITFKDVELLPVAGALIDITRKYVSEGVFKTVELPLTDDAGQVIGHLVLSDEIYTFIVSLNGRVLGTFQNVVAFCENQATGDCKINLNVFGDGFIIPDFITIGNLNLETTYDRDTRIITTLFTSVDGSVVTVNSNGTLNDALGNTTVCSDSLTSSSGTITCTIPNSFGNSSVVYRVLNDQTVVSQSIFSTQLTPAELFGGTRVVLLIILFSTISLMALTSGPATLFLSLMAMIMGGLLNLFITGSLIGSTSILLWFAIAIFILLFKMSRRDAT